MTLSDEEICAAFARLSEFKTRKDSLTELWVQRDKDCNLLGFPDYDAYRASALWKRIRRRTLKRDQKVCVRCDGRADQVHHRSYSLEVLKGNEDDLLVSICRGCHKIIHYNELRGERFIYEWDGILFKKDRNANFPPFTIDRRRLRENQVHPKEWPRMSAQQKAAWIRERDRQFDLWLHKSL